MKILVTGGAGFIGSNFIRHVLGLRKGYQVVNFDKLTYAGNLANVAAVESDPNYRFVKGDICDPAAVEAAIRGCDAVVHFAAESHVDRSIYQPATAIDTNVMGTSILLQVARATGIARFVQISTDEVYGDIPPGAFADRDLPRRPQQSLFCFESGSRSAGSVLCSYLRLSHYDHAFFQQLRAFPIS